MERRLRLGMVGGGQGAFIGAVHRIAARLDDQWELVAGALSSDPARARASAAYLGIAPDRAYTDWAAMALAEAARADGIDAVAIVTPNHLHAGPAVAFLRAGIAVICDKPLAATAEQAQAIAEAVHASGRPFVLTHTYAGYPMIRQARAMVAAGALGQVRLVQVEYAQGWLATDARGKQADWRTDPVQAGAGAIGDIGTHAFHLAGHVSGLQVAELAADLSSMVPGRAVDDDARILLRFHGGARGMLWASQVAIGHENGLRLRVYGTEGSLDWHQENPNLLIHDRLNQPRQILTRGGAGTQAAVRTPSGHPEGYLEAFATLYADAAALIRGSATDIPGIEDGLRGMRFIAACQASSRNNCRWVAL